MKVARYACLLVALVVGKAQIGTSTASDQAAILALERAWNQAVLQKDAKALGPLLDDELVYIYHDGRIVNKAQYLADVKAPEIHFEHIVSESMQVQLFAKSAIVIGIYRERGTRNGKSYVRSELFVDAWIQRDRAWVCVTSQSTLTAH